MGVAPTGNGRRESYAHLPMPRMTNTYMLAGETDPQELIRSVKKVIYCPSLCVGQVYITTGKFVFSTCAASLIDAGKITSPLYVSSLIGIVPAVLYRLSLVFYYLSLVLVFRT